MQRRRVWILISIPAGILAVLLVVAEIANQLIVNVLVSGVRHPLWGVYELALTLAAVGALPLAGFLWLRHLPRESGDGFFDPFSRWLREGADQEAARRAARWTKESRRGRAGRFAVLGAGASALVAAIVLAAIGAPGSTHPRQTVPLPRGARVGACAPAPCAALGVGTLVVTALTNHYTPSHLSSGARGFSDDGAAPFGDRYVRVLVRFTPRRGTSAPRLRRVLRLDDGSALRRPTALSFDRACRTATGADASKGVIPLCFLAHGTRHSPLVLVWKAAHLRLPL